MKKITLLMATLFVVSMMITGCKKDDPTPEPTPDTYAVVYKIDNHYENLFLSPCFKMNVSYTDANGQLVTENNVTLPWSKSVDVEVPFHAKLMGTLTYNEEELPDYVIFGFYRGIGLYVNGSGNVPMEGGMGGMTKENFLIAATEHPDQLQFTMEKDF